MRSLAVRKVITKNATATEAKMAIVYDQPLASSPPPNLPICIVHGWKDAIVPVENSIRFAKECDATLHLVDGDHRLSENNEEINEYLRIFVEKTSE